MAAVLKIFKYQTQLQFDLRYERSSQIMPKKFFTVITSSMTSQGGVNISIYIHV